MSDGPAMYEKLIVVKSCKARTSTDSLRDRLSREMATNGWKSSVEM